VTCRASECPRTVPSLRSSARLGVIFRRTLRPRIGPAPAEPCVDMGGEFREVPTRNLAGIMQMFVERGTWPFPTPRPGEPGCKVPSNFMPPQFQAPATGAVA
jgi:hypothetical protein